MLVTNNYCWIRRLMGHNLYSQPVYGMSDRVPCVIADLSSGLNKTSVRADSSASRGRANEMNADGLLLMPTFVRVDEDDLVKVDGVDMVVKGVSKRFDSFGRESHKEVYLKIWASKQDLL